MIKRDNRVFLKLTHYFISKDNFNSKYHSDRIETLENWEEFIPSNFIHLLDIDIPFTVKKKFERLCETSNLFLESIYMEFENDSDMMLFKLKYEGFIPTVSLTLKNYTSET